MSDHTLKYRPPQAFFAQSHNTFFRRKNHVHRHDFELFVDRFDHGE